MTVFSRLRFVSRYFAIVINTEKLRARGCFYNLSVNFVLATKLMFLTVKFSAFFSFLLLSLLGKTSSPANVPSAELLALTPPGGPQFNIMLHLTLLLHLLVLSCSHSGM